MLRVVKNTAYDVLQRTRVRANRRKLLVFYAQFIDAGDLCFDVGANVGNRTDVFLALGAQVVCIEPQPACVRRLVQKYRDNPNVFIVSKGLSARSGVLPLSLCESVNTIATFSEKWKTGRFQDYRWESVVPVPVTTLDALIEEFGVPALCKIDVEGFEYQVLQGLSSPVVTLSFEFTREFMDDAESCIDLLASIGPVKFNYVLGQSALLMLPQWTDGATVLNCLQQTTDDLLWGDIYAKFQSPQ